MCEVFDSYDLPLSGYKNPTLQAWFKQWKEVITSDQTLQAMDSYTCRHYALLFLKAKARNVLKALVEQEWCYWQENFNECVTHCLDPAVMCPGRHTVTRLKPYSQQLRLIANPRQSIKRRRQLMSQQIGAGAWKELNCCYHCAKTQFCY